MMRLSVQTGSLMVRTVAGATVIALAFQYGHFLEHILQVAAWLAGHTNSPYMTDFGYWLSHLLATLFFEHESPDRLHRLGMELLHLFGNVIYLVGIVGLWGFMRTKVVLTALIIEGLHVFEHLMLTATTIYFDTGLGLSTLYGMPMSDYASVAYRVWWHFMANAIPTALVTYAIVKSYTRHLRREQTVKVAIPNRMATRTLFSNG